MVEADTLLVASLGGQKLEVHKGELSVDKVMAREDKGMALKDTDTEPD